MKQLVLWSLFLLLPSWGHAAVWSIHQSWTSQHEVAFSVFIEKDFHAEIFSSPTSPFYGLKTDCADAVYAARIIFAAKNGLPVQFADPTKSGSYITQKMSRWDHLPEAQRLRGFLEYVSDLSSTYTLELDTYHVQISKEGFRPGVIFLSPHLSDEEKRRTGFNGGHAEYVKSITDTGFVEVISSTSPRLVRTLSQSKNPYMAPLLKRAGYRIWKQPGHYGQRPENLPNFGLNQFELADWAPLKLINRRQIFQWHEEIRRLLRTRIPTFEERVDVVVESICGLLKTRAKLVHQGWSQVASNGNRCLSGDLRDEFSTDSRDKRIRDAYLQVRDLYDWKKRTDGDADLAGDISDGQALLEQCRFEHWPGRQTSAWEMASRSLQGELVSSADYAPAVRWGDRRPAGKDCR